MVNLEAKQLAIVKSILNHYIPTAEIWIFGSRITDNYKPYSDLDLIIKHCDSLDKKTLFKLMDAFEESDLIIKIDLLDWQTTSPEFHQVVLKNYQIFDFRQ